MLNVIKLVFEMLNVKFFITFDGNALNTLGDKKWTRKREKVWWSTCVVWSWVPLIVFYYQTVIKLITQTSENTKIVFLVSIIQTQNFEFLSYGNNHPKPSQTIIYLWDLFVLDDGSWKLSNITQFSCYPNKVQNPFSTIELKINK